MDRIVLSVLLAMVAGLGLVACNGTEQPATGTQFSVMSTAAAQPQPAAAATAAPKADPAPVAAAKPPSVFDAPQPDGTMATCPVMGNTLTIKADTPRSEYQGKYVYFCCPGCKPQFDADPAKYLK
jgi:YHS domain-containing protein